MSSSPSPSLIVIGGGAAGFFAALHAQSLAPHATVTILEAAGRPLGKVKISGGGRCNVTHHCTDLNTLIGFYPRNGRSMKKVFGRFMPMDTVAWFESRGVKLKTEPDGRMFPVTDDSQTIIDCLMQTARAEGVRLRTHTPVNTLSRSERGVEVVTAEETLRADAVLVATGSNPQALKWLAQLGHQLIPQVPSLFTFNIQDPLLSGLEGISFPWVRGTLQANGETITQEGPLLITHWGLSGPAILRLSAWGARALHATHYHGTLFIDFFPTVDSETLRTQCLAQKTAHPKKHIATSCPWELPRRFWERLLTLSEIPPERPWVDVPHKSLNKLVDTLKRCPFTVQGKGVFKEEFVTAGGVPLSEIDLATMQSKKVPGLFFAGEVIDVDGLTGGFNFQNAWATGWVAGEAMAKIVPQSI
jgi:predicted Rossmann fold flavoprotein